MRLRLCLLLILCLFLLSGCNRKYYEDQYEELDARLTNEIIELEEKYEDASSRADDYSDAIGKAEDHLITLRLFFEGDEDITYDEASSAAESLHDLFYPFY